jgi:prepilin signal peptidase PulO-like enzyme (type II secretory pathway)
LLVFYLIIALAAPVRSLTGATMIVLRRATRRTLIPFGPALIEGAFTALLAAVG